MKPRWWPQPFAPEGSAAAEGIVRQLGQPTLDPLAVLVREAAQNSWDARLPDEKVEFRVDIRTLGEDADAWRNLLLPGPPADAGIDIEKALRPEAVALTISDRNTRGLGGPLRADQQAGTNELPDFVKFLRNVGEPNEHQFGGGTYGFGKGIFYRISRIGTILVETHTSSGGPHSHRLMGAALGRSWHSGGRRFTGRHWWGLPGGDGIPDPVVDSQAEAVSEALRLPGFSDARSGTDIVILDANLGYIESDSNAHVRSPEEAASFIASSILWHLWPKMILDERGRGMTFSVCIDGSPIALPSPEAVDELAPFVTALRAVRRGEGTVFTRTVRPKVAGFFAMTLSAAREEGTRPSIKAAKPFEGPPHHVARMRVAELVVDYLPGPVHPDPLLAYGGVFKASEEADPMFASAEPPTHDDWVTKGLTGTARGVVTGARRFIQKQLDEHLNLDSQAGGPGGQGLGQLAALLADVIPARVGDMQPPEAGDAGDISHGGWTFGSGGNGNSHRGHGGAAPPRRGRPRIVGTPMLQVHQGHPYLVASVKVPGSEVTRVLSADAFVVLEGGAHEIEPPLGAAVPKIIGWQSSTGDIFVDGKTIEIAPGDETDWYVYATYVPDAVVRFRIGQVAPHGR